MHSFNLHLPEKSGIYSLKGKKVTAQGKVERSETSPWVRGM